MASELNELQNATVGMVVGVIEVRLLHSSSMYAYYAKDTATSRPEHILVGTACASACDVVTKERQPFKWSLPAVCFVQLISPPHVSSPSQQTICPTVLPPIH